jgi:hypothetical protein
VLKLQEEYSGVGDLSRQDQPLGRVRYRIARYQAVLPGNGLPIPGTHRIEGRIEPEPARDLDGFVDAPLVLRLEDGRALSITLADRDGRVFSEGHGPSRCRCCS